MKRSKFSRLHPLTREGNPDMDAKEPMIEGRPGGPMMTVSYIMLDPDTASWAMVDPTFDVMATWRDRWARLGNPAAVYITHGHIDHIGGLHDFLESYPDVPVWIHALGRPMLESTELNGSSLFGLPYQPVSPTDEFIEGETIQLGMMDIELIRADGHCPGSIMLKSGRHLIAGDVIFDGSTGRWDLPGGDYDTLAESIREKVMVLPDETIIYPGHGGITTVGTERRLNPIVHRMLAGEPVP
jgi:hydroxyacylglutathione hydrolase